MPRPELTPETLEMMALGALQTNVFLSLDRLAREVSGPIRPNPAPSPDTNLVGPLTIPSGNPMLLAYAVGVVKLALLPLDQPSYRCGGALPKSAALDLELVIRGEKTRALVGWVRGKLPKAELDALYEGGPDLYQATIRNWRSDIKVDQFIEWRNLRSI